MRALTLLCVLIAPVSFGRVLFFGSGTSEATLLANIPQPADAKIWTKFRVKEAFVSRATSEKFKDSFSVAEFGWMILAPDGRPLARGDLYTDLYYPLAPDAPVRLAFVERDVFQDDRVALLDLAPGMERCTLTDAGDFVQFERTPVEPDRNSGADARPGGAHMLSGDFADQVDFREGDYTDYIRLPEGPATLMLIRENFALDWDLPGVLEIEDVRMNRFPEPGSDAASPTPASNTGAPFVYPEHPRDAVLLRFVEAGAKSPRPLYLRLRSAIGGGRQAYRIFIATGPGADENLLNRWLAYLRSQKSNDQNDTTTRADFGFARLADLSNAFIGLRGADAAAVCRGKIGLDRKNISAVPSGSGADRERVFCAHLLYTMQAKADLQALVARYGRESKFYQAALWSMDRQARRVLEEPESVEKQTMGGTANVSVAVASPRVVFYSDATPLN